MCKITYLPSTVISFQHIFRMESRRLIGTVDSHFKQYVYSVLGGQHYIQALKILLRRKRGGADVPIPKKMLKEVSCAIYGEKAKDEVELYISGIRQAAGENVQPRTLLEEVLLFYRYEICRVIFAFGTMAP